MKLYKTVIMVLLLLFTSCDIIVEPKRLYNFKATSPSVEELSTKYLYNGKHIDGTIKFRVDIEDVDFEIAQVSLMVDDDFVNSSYQDGYLTLNTREYNEGAHIVSILFYEINRNHGMLNLINSPTLYRQTEVIFDRTPPHDCSIDGELTYSNKAILMWEKTKNENFYAYRVMRGLIGHGFRDTVAIIYDKDSLSCFDDSLPEYYGLGYQYQVQVATDQYFQYISYGQDLKLYYGAHNKIEEFNSFNTRKIITNPINREYYLLGESELFALDMDSHNLIKSISLPNLSYKNSFTISGDYSTFYVFDAMKNTIDIIETQNFSLLAHQQLINTYTENTRSLKVIWMDEYKLLILNDDKLYYYDTQNSNTIDFVELDIKEHQINLDRIDNSKIVISAKYDNGYKLRIRDVTQLGLPVVIERTTPINYFDLYVDGDNQKIYAKYLDNPIKIYSTHNLDLIETIEIDNLYSFYVEENSLYTSQYHYSIYNNVPIEGAKITLWDIKSKTKMKTYLAKGCFLSNLSTFSTEKELVLTSINPNYPVTLINK